MIIDRRFVIKAPAVFGASLLLKQLGFGMPGMPATTEFEQFVSQAGEYARPMIADPGRNEYEYLLRVASLAVSVKRFPDAEFGPAFKNVLRSAMSYRGSGIAVIQWRMEPNTVYPAHNHPGYNGITIGLRGECRMRNFDFVEAAPDMKSKTAFLVRETQDSVLRPGVVTSIMSTSRDNIHELRAGKDGVIAADIIAKVGPDQGFSFLNIPDKAQDPQDQVYEATWGEHYGT